MLKRVFDRFLSDPWYLCSAFKSFSELYYSPCQGYVFAGVCLSTEPLGLGGCTSPMDTHIPGRPLDTHTPLGHTPSWTPPLDTPNGQQAGGMHPTGMLSCGVMKLPLFEF